MTPRALVIEDDHAIRLLLQAVLAHESIGCDHSPDGADGLRKIDQEEYDAIVLDLLLPVVDGFEIVRRIRTSRPHLLRRVVVMTAAADSLWRSWADRDTVRCVLRKPVDIEELVGHIRGCIAERQD